MGADKELPEGFKSLTALADNGDADAQYNLGMMYYGGQGVEKDFKEDFERSTKSAEQNNPYAQHTLGTLYANGQGVEKDFVTALAWLYFAAANGDELAKKSKEDIAKVLNPEQITKAEELVKEMLKNPKLLK